MTLPSRFVLLSARQVAIVKEKFLVKRMRRRRKTSRRRSSCEIPTSLRPFSVIFFFFFRHYSVLIVILALFLSLLIFESARSAVCSRVVVDSFITRHRPRQRRSRRRKGIDLSVFDRPSKKHFSHFLVPSVKETRLCKYAFLRCLAAN